MSENEKLPTTLGIDFGGTSVKAGVCRGSEILGEIDRIPTQEFSGPDPLIDAIEKKIIELRDRHPEISAVGVGVPGAVNFQTGVTFNLTNVPGWNSVALRDLLQVKSALPTVVDNDANCMTFAEWKYGAGQGFENVVCVTLGTGVGGGLILNGSLYRGSQFAAGEIGQISVDYRGVEGPYGNTGALERYIGNRQIGELAQKKYEAAGISVSEEDTFPVTLAEKARERDAVASAVWNDVAEYLGTALSGVIFLLNPDAIVIGGGVAHAGDLLFEPLKKNLKKSLSPEFFESLQVIPANFGNTAGIIGSSALASELI